MVKNTRYGKWLRRVTRADALARREEWRWEEKNALHPNGRWYVDARGYHPSSLPGALGRRLGNQGARSGRTATVSPTFADKLPFRAAEWDSLRERGAPDAHIPYRERYTYGGKPER